MRATSFVVCVALVAHAAAHIFPKKYMPKHVALEVATDYVDQQYPEQKQYKPKPHQYKQHQPIQQYQSQEQYQQYQPQEQNQLYQPIEMYQQYQPQEMSQKYQSQEKYQNYQTQEKYQQYQPQEKYEQYQSQKKYQQYQPQEKYQQYQPQEKYQQYQPQEKYQQYQPQEKYQQYQPMEQQQYHPIEQQQSQYDQNYQPQDEKKFQKYQKYQKQQKEAIRSQMRSIVDPQPGDSQEIFMRNQSIRSQSMTPHSQPTPVRPWIQPTFSNVQDSSEVAPAYGDVIAWRDIQIADGPNSPITDKKEIERIFQEAYKTMVHIKPEDKHEFHTAFEAAAHDHENYLEAQMNATQLIQKHGFEAEEHVVRTDDGYELTALRVRSGGARGPVLLLHGLLGGADDWLLMGPRRSLAFQLAAAGHDVWLASLRGSRYARRHATLHPAQPEFWHFSVDDIALHDLPATIDRALQVSGQSKLHIVGHSLGATAALELLAERPAYGDKVSGVTVMSPMVYTGAARSPLLRMLAPASPFRELLAAQLGDGEFRPPRELLSSLGGALLQAELGCRNVSGNARLVLAGVRLDSAAAARAAAVAARAQDAGAVRVLRQLAAAAGRRLARADRGAANRAAYGAAEPPALRLERVAAPVLLLAAPADWLAAPADVARLAAELPRGALRSLEDPHFTSLDFLFSPQTAAVNDLIIQNIAETASA